MANHKEVHYFDTEECFEEGAPDYEVYHAHFSCLGSGIAGEATPIYMYWRGAMQRIYDYNPGIKIILLLRNPIDRAYSHWNMERSRDADALPFLEAITREDERCSEAAPQQHRVYSYIDRGRYARQIQNIWQLLPKEQVLILKNEELRDALHETLARVTSFLGVSDFPLVAHEDVHSRDYEAGMGQDAHDYLVSVFRPEILELEQLLGWDCSDWLKPLHMNKN